MSVLLVGDATEHAGYNGAHGGGQAAGHVFVHKVTAAATGTITSLGAWMRGDSDYASLDIVVYANSGGTPGALLGYGTASNPGLGEHDSAWVDTGAVSIAVTSGTVYWIGLLPVGGTVARWNAGDTETDDYWATSSTVSTPPSPWPGGFNFSGSDARPFGLRCLGSGAVLLAGDDTEYPAPFGNTDSVSDGFAQAYRFVADRSGTITTLSAWVKSTSDYDTLDLLVYGGASEPGTLLGSGTAPPPVGDAWVDATVEIPVTGGLTYWLAFQPHGGFVTFNVGTDSSYLDWASDSSSASPFDPFGAEEGLDETGNQPGFRGLGTDVEHLPGLEFHVTGLAYPDVETITYYGRIADPADGSNVTIPLGDSRLGEVTLPLFDPVVADLVHHAYARMLKVYYNDDLVYWGPVKLNEVDFDAGTVKVNAVDPSIRAIRHYLRRGDIDGDLSAPHDDKSAVNIDGDGFRLLLDAARNIPEQTVRGCPDIGIDTGIDGATLRADHFIGISRGQEVWDSILALSQSSLGPDFELRPTEDIPGAYCELVTDDRIGEDKTTEVQLHYNTGFNNLDGLSFTEGSEYVTHAHVLSSDGRRVSAVNVEASAETGQYTWWEATGFSAQDLDPDKLDEALAAVGEAIVNAYGRPLVVITLKMPLDAEDGYLYGRDYDVGDTISVAGKKGYVELEEAPYRITQVKLVKEGDGVRPEIQVVPSRVEAFGDTVSTSEDS